MIRGLLLGLALGALEFVCACAAFRDDPASVAACALDAVDTASEATARANDAADRACGAYAEAVALGAIKPDARITGRCAARRE